MEKVKIRQLVSIGMPVYNGEKYIRQALDSLLAQDFEDFELIISDNASKDATQEICQEYAVRDKRIQYFRDENNQGPISNFNRVLQIAQGDYFMWAASDDLWEPSYVSTLLRNLIAHTGTIIAFSAFNNINERGNGVRTYPHLFELPSDNLFQRLWNYIMQEEHLGKANLIYGLMRRDAIQSAGGFKVWGGSLWGIDMLVVFRLLSLGNLVLTKELLFHKRLVTSLNSPHKGKITSLTTRILRYCSTIWGWHGYFSGYGHIIHIVDGLTFQEKASLRAALWRRASQVYWKRIQRALVCPIQWVAR